MSTALHEPSVPEEPGHTPHAVPSPSHLRPVPQQQLQITPVSNLLATDVRQVARLDEVPMDPVDEYEPSKFLKPRKLTSVFPARRTPSSQTMDRRYRQQLASIKKMTQTIGAAFIEAELGIRPYMQLSSWMELELFQKLRARVEHSVNEKYLAARRGEEGSKKVPSIETLGVRASPKANGEWEASMTIRVGQRARAIAMRLQLHRDRWRVIAFEVG
ncbi:Rv3235 family protein [Enteractinococcus helveticum]|uniref:Uncharacterized protein n=1 Tax=Enteractinococcus helveticum TaxID=1837282 RepID=A0A1B7LWW3_9MICC|nr:Rv3235 family protein [Enteractinococcus helveticum]OAV59520.1 hypothetical protein A6F49_16935 [Enteractinococcus helveticum]